jgi:hypothetical protein
MNTQTLSQFGAFATTVTAVEEIHTKMAEDYVQNEPVFMLEMAVYREIMVTGKFVMNRPE